MCPSIEANTSVRKSNPGTGFALGGGIALLSITAATAVYPTYSVRSQAISYLGGSGVPTEIFWNLCVILVGLLWLWSTYLLFHKSGSRIKPVVFYLAGLGFILVGTSPWNLRPLTHYLGAQLIFIFGAFSCLIGFRITTGSLSKLSLISGLFSITSYVSGYFGSYYLLGPGGIERMIYYPILMWEIAFGGYLISHFNDGESFNERRLRA